MRTKQAECEGSVSRRILVLCVVLVGLIAGGVVLDKLMPQSDLGAILFMLGIFLGLPVLVAELQPTSRAAPKDKVPEAMEQARPSEPAGSGEPAPRLDVTELSYRCEPAGESARLKISWACQWVAGRGLRSFN